MKSEPLGEDWSLATFAETHWANLLEEARTWHGYGAEPATGWFRGTVNYVELRYTRQRTATDCVEQVTTYLLRSSYFPVRARGFAVTAAFCEGTRAETTLRMKNALANFQEQ